MNNDYGRILNDNKVYAKTKSNEVSIDDMSENEQNPFETNEEFNRSVSDYNQV